MTPANSRARRECPHCKSAIRPDATVCPHCQRESAPWRWHEGKWWVGNNWLHEPSNTFVRSGEEPPAAARTRTSSERLAVASVIVGAIAGIVSEVYLHLSDLWPPLPFLVGLFIAGSLYGGLIEIKAHENLADRE